MTTPDVAQTAAPMGLEDDSDILLSEDVQRAMQSIADRPIPEIGEMLRAISSLRIAVDSTIADDIAAKADAAIDRAFADRTVLQRAVTGLQQHIDRLDNALVARDEPVPLPEECSNYHLPLAVARRALDGLYAIADRAVVRDAQAKVEAVVYVLLRDNTKLSLLLIEQREIASQAATKAWQYDNLAIQTPAPVEAPE